ncbi:MAG: hypothetical protein O3B13_06775 [Planctomycetota bacterium]|nr:hypothetical protein [Planctomycetota bacterium]MDA1162787.1 hypothetical protein [Planctomycetota bacterium]
MLELVIGAIILSVFFSIMGPMLHWIQISKRTNERHLAAMQELSSKMERLSAIPSSDLNDEYLQSLAVSESTRTLLPDAELTASLTPGEQQMQRLSLAISWTNAAGRPVEPKRLTAWFPLEPKGGTE